MAAIAKTYSRLPGTGSHAFQYVRLYLGPDHLLQVTSTGFTESYKRFYFHNIQSVIWQHSIVWHIWSAIWAGLAAMFAGIALVAGGDAQIWLLGIGLFWILMLLANLMIGPSCRCYLTTAVQTQKLPSMKRVRRTRKFLDRLRPLIAQAQGELAPEVIAAQIDQVRQSPFQPESFYR
jgi:hypothetical protein